MLSHLSGYTSLVDGSQFLGKLGKAVSAGSYPRVFPVRGSITFATGFAWNNR